MLNSVLKIEQQLECGVCMLSLNHAFILSNCGHRYCLNCIEEALAKDPHCPTCQKPANLQHLIKDPQFDHLVTYINKLKGALLNHTLTPLEYSLQQQVQQDGSEPMSLDTQDFSTDSNDNVHPPVEAVEKKVHKKPNDENEVDEEPAKKKHKTSDDTEKQKLLDPGAFFDDMMPTFDSQLFKSLNSQNNSVPAGPSQDFHSVKGSDLGPLPVSVTIEKLNDVTAEKETEDKQEQPNNESSPSVEISNKEPPSIPVTTTVENSMDKSIDLPEESSQIEIPAIPKHIDLQEDATIFSSQDIAEKWECPQCKFANPDFLQTCSVCRTYRNTNLTMKKPPARKKSKDNAPKSKDNAPKSKPEYQLTVAGENNTMENVPEMNIRAQAEAKAQREAHILYTGLTPEDDKKLEKIKDEASHSRLKIIIHYQMRDFSEITHIVTSVNRKKLCKRTLKYLQGVLDGKWIVEPEWLIKSVQSKEWQPEEKYEVQGDQQSGTTHAPSKSRENQDKKLFEDMKFYFFGDFTGKHNKNDLLILCRAGGAKLLNRKPPAVKNLTDEIDLSEPVVIMNKETKKKPAWLKECQVRDPSWIIDCIGTLRVK